MSILGSPIRPELGLLDTDEWLHKIIAETEEKRELKIAKSFESLKDTEAFDESDINRFVDSKLARQTHKAISPQHTNQQVIYQPITDGQEIRVLEVYPGSGSSTIEGSLHHCSIEFIYSSHQAPNSTIQSTLRCVHAVSLTKKQPLWYTALSYVWGPPVFSSTILCNGKKFSITPDLEAALLRLRRKDESIFLWVDQICINQKDNKEKSKQVQLMYKVYQRAFSTVIWLGSDPGGAELGFQALRTTQKYLQLESLRGTTSDVSESFSIPGITPEAWEAVRKLFKRPWFERVWVIQEVICSSDSHVVCGSANMSWYDLDAVCWELADRKIDNWLEWSDPKSKIFKNNSGIRAVGEIGRLGLRYPPRSTESDSVAVTGSQEISMSVLVDTRYAKATDPRDKVYGTLGICRMPIPVDYNKTVEDIYYETTLLVLRENVRRTDTFTGTRKESESMIFYWHGVYQVLCCIDHEPQVSKLPSWTVDWSKPRHTRSLGYSTFSTHMYHASDHTRIDILRSVAIDEARKCLKVSGQIVDSIERLTSVDSSGIISDENPSENNKHLREAVALVKSCTPYPSRDSLFEAFWKTMVAGKDGSETQPCRPECAEVFSLLLDETTGKHPSLPDQTYSPRQQQGKFGLTNLKAEVQAFRDLQKAYATAMTNRRVCVTRKKHIGIVPRYCQKDDYVCVFAGCHVPFVIRKRDQKQFELLGECYIHGMMEGEVMGMEGNVDGCDMRTIELV